MLKFINKKSTEIKIRMEKNQGKNKLKIFWRLLFGLVICLSIYPTTSWKFTVQNNKSQRDAGGRDKRLHFSNCIGAKWNNKCFVMDSNSTRKIYFMVIAMTPRLSIAPEKMLIFTIELERKCQISISCVHLFFT